MALELAEQGTREEVSSGARRARVLVLDDNPIDIEMVSRCLRRFEGWDIDVIGCQTVDQAIDESAGGDIDLMFLDYWLHHETGLAALERMRADGLDVPTILMTGMRGEAVLVEALQAGVVDYLPKSAIKPAAVQRAAKNAIEKSELTKAVRQKQAALVETIQRLEARNREIGSFYHNVSHELKTPLTGAREFVSLVIDGAAGDINDSQRDLLTASLRSCDQMVTCINDMLDAARLETGKLSYNPRDQDLRAVVDDAVMSLRGSATDAGIELVTSAPQEPVTLCIDPQRVFQVASNLVTNAIKFSPKGSEVRVEIERTDAGAIVRVIDHGRGLEPGTEKNIFDRLYQSKKEDAATLGGLGMGLYICREIVRLHGGDISVESQPGEGCTFTFELPRHAPQSESTES